MPHIFSCRARLLVLAGCLCAVVAMPVNASTPGATEHVSRPAIRQAAAQIGQTLEAVQQTPGSFPARR